MRPIFRNIVIVFILLVLSAVGGCAVMIQSPLLLLVGWYAFLKTILPHVSVNPVMLGEGIAIIFVLGIGGHYFLVWLYENFGTSGEGQALKQRWLLKWSFSGLTIFLLMFVTSIAVTGFIHQTVWLFTSSGPVVESNWGPGSPRYATNRNMRQVGAALSKCQAERGSLPKQMEPVELQTVAFPGECAVPGAYKDGWGTPFMYSSNGTSYVVKSYGKNRIAGGGVGDFDDWIFSDGEFIVPISERQTSPEPPRQVTSASSQATASAGKIAIPLSAPPVPSCAQAKEAPGQTRREIAGKDGALMALVPAGEFPYGDKNECVFLPAFYVDKYKVTTSRYAQFMQDAQRMLRAAATEIPAWNDMNLAIDGKRPVIGVNWYGANAYCRYYGKRLPTEQEWEKAARGTDGRKYPWGNEQPTDQHANFGKCTSLLDNDRCDWKGYSQTLTMVGIFESGKSPYGVYDMAGNVEEWTSSDSDDIGKVVRGSTWTTDAERLRSVSRNKAFPPDRFVTIGFRCAQDAPTENPRRVASEASHTFREYINEGRDMLKRGNAGNALIKFEQALWAAKKETDLAEAYVLRGTAKLTLGTYAESAQWDVDRAIQLRPDFSEAYSVRAWAKGNRADYRGSIEDATMAISLDKTNFWAYNNRGWAEYKSGMTGEALADFTTAIKMQPQDDAPYINRAIVKEKLGDQSGAIDDMAGAAGINQELADPVKTNKIVEDLYRSKKYDQALPLARWGIELATKVRGREHPDTATALQNLAELYRALGEHAKAEPLARRSQEIRVK